MKLSDLCSYYKEKRDVSTLDRNHYVSTENMLPNKSGVYGGVSLPSTTQTSAFQKGDVLVSNIRPYFKKIWLATFDGGCSNDVLVFRVKKGVPASFLYYVLANDSFFDYATATSKGTKMPRGDKSAIMDYDVPDLPYDVQVKIATILSSLDKKIALNEEINHNLSA